MSQELKTKFTADASDFNGAVKQIEGKLKSVGKLGQGFGLGNITGGVGNILGGIGGLGGLAGAGGIGLAAAAVTKAFGSLSERIDERAEAMEAGFPVGELTSFGQKFLEIRENLAVMGRVFTGLPRLVLEGLDAYEQFVFYGNELEDEAKKQAELAKGATQRMLQWYDKENKEREQIVKDAARRREQEREKKRSEYRAEADKKNQQYAQIDELLQGMEPENNIKLLERLGASGGRFDLSKTRQETDRNVFAYEAELLKLYTQVEKILPGLLTKEQISAVYGEDIRNKIALESGKVSESIQSSPDITDRLRRIGANGGDYPSQTVQTFRDMRSIAQQSLEVQRQIKTNTEGGSLKLR